MDFGRPVELASQMVEPADVLFDSLFCRTVCDVQVLGTHEIVPASNLVLQVFCGSGAFESPIFRTLLPVSPNCDCSFLIGGAAELAEEDQSAVEDQSTTSGPLLLTFAVYEGHREKLVGSATTDLRIMPHVKAGVQPPQCFAPLMRMGECHGFVQFRVGVSLETERNGLLSRRGFATRSLPFRVGYGDLILARNSTALARLISLATSSSWDHVAVVTCNKQGKDLMLMEATSDGCNAYPFDERVGAVLRTVRKKKWKEERKKWTFSLIF